MRACVLHARKFIEPLIKIDDRPLFVPDSTTLFVPVIVLRLIIFAIHTLNEKQSDQRSRRVFLLPFAVSLRNRIDERESIPRFLHRKHDPDVVSDLISTLTKTNDER